MNQRPSSQGAFSLSVGDIYYALFRHKGKILAISALGIAAALALPFVVPTPYQSEAKLFIRYVLESKSPGPVGMNDPRIKSPDDRGENVINTELEILTSLDLAHEVATNVGPERILAKVGGGNDADRAAGIIHANLIAEVPKRSNVIRIVFRHRDRQIVQPVLNGLIDAYLRRHAEVHRSVGVFDQFLTQETGQLRARLLETEHELRRAKTNAGIISLDDSKKAYGEEIARIRQQILDAEAELAERQAAAGELAKLLQTRPSAATNQAAITNEVALPDNRITEYRHVCSLLDALEKEDLELSLQFTPTSSLVQGVRSRIAENEKLKKQLEDEYPGLVAVKISEPRAATADPASAARADLLAEVAKATALQSKIKVLNDQLETIRKEANLVDDAEGPITELERKKELEEAHYKYFSASLEQSRIDEALGPGRVSNISKIQAPSPPFQDRGKIMKVQAMVLIGGLALALALAILIELQLDRSLKRPVEVEAKLGLPLFLSIPLVSQNGRPHLLDAIRKSRLLPESSPTPEPAGHNGLNGNGHPRAADTAAVVSHSTSAHPAGLQPFYEALRDRLITYFEVRNLTHKPKLVSVTSCGEGSGVSTIAKGLAASLSETGDGNVLLVDMNEHGSTRQFFRGDLACGLDDALEKDKRSHALVQENLYVVSEMADNDKLPRALPRRFTHLVPRLKASDYDYIIFDMPPISQISFTPRLARFMDMVLLVVESEKTDRDLVKRAAALLFESQSNVGVVLNKRRTYVPERLHQEW